MADRYDLVILGMGSAGMSAAELAATLPIRAVAVERGRVGGDCLWTGCVPSKAVLASAKAAHTMRTADRWGLPAVDPEVDTEAVWKRLRAVQEEIAGSDDDPDRYRRLGIEILAGSARLTGPRTVEVDTDDGRRRVLRTRFTLVCTGSRPADPGIPGLAASGYLTSESIFELDRPPASLTFVGGGPIATELAQALRRLGVATTVVQRGERLLPKDEPDLVRRLEAVLADEGVALALGAEVDEVRVEGGRKVVTGRVGDDERRWEADEVFVATGRSPNLEGLGLDDVGVEVADDGVVVDAGMRTSVPTVYAAGDVAGGALFTHSAGHEAVQAVRNMFFPGRASARELVPWCTFTDPELAHAGLTSAEARERHGAAVEVHRLPLSSSDRARAEGHPEGEVVVVTAGGAVVGAHVLAPAAGEVVHELALAIDRGVSLGDLARLVHVYPTYATSVGQLAADAAYDDARRFHWAVRPTIAWRAATGVLRRAAGSRR